MRAYAGFDKSVVAVAARPDAIFGKIGIPVSWPLVVNWWGYEAESSEVLRGLSAQSPPSFAIHRLRRLMFSAVDGIAFTPFACWLTAPINPIAVWESPPAAGIAAAGPDARFLGAGEAGGNAGVMAAGTTGRTATDGAGLAVAGGEGVDVGGAGLAVVDGAGGTTMGSVVGGTATGELVVAVDRLWPWPAVPGCPRVVAVARAGVDVDAEDTTNPKPTIRDPAAAADTTAVRRPPARSPCIAAPGTIVTTRSLTPPMRNAVLMAPEVSSRVSRTGSNLAWPSADPTPSRRPYSTRSPPPGPHS